MKLDFEIADEGVIVLFTPITERAHRWVEANVAEDRLWFGPSLVIERTFAPVLVSEMSAEGLLLAACREAYAQ
jgi:hypothetical protein